MRIILNYFCVGKIVAMSRENKHFAYVKTQAQISSVTVKLIISFVFATDRTISLLFKSKIYKIHPSYVLVPLGLCWTYIVGFLMVRLIYWLLLSKICVYRQWIK